MLPCGDASIYVAMVMMQVSMLPCGDASIYVAMVMMQVHKLRTDGFDDNSITSTS